MTRIHATAIVDPQAELAEDVQVGPYAVIGPQVRIGARTVIGAHVVIDGRTTIGCDNRFFPSSSIGALPQDDSARMPLTVVNAALWHVVGKRVTLKYELANVFNSKPTMAIGERLNSVSQIDYYGRSAFLHVILR